VRLKGWIDIGLAAISDRQPKIQIAIFFGG
jgi:hypothetical protein